MAMATAATASAPGPVAAGRVVRQALHWQERLALALLVACCAALAFFLLGPLFMILVKSVQDKDGAFVGLLQFRDYLGTPALRQSIFNTLGVALVVTGITIPLAFTFAYALTRSAMPGKAVFRVVGLTPILAPSLLAAISFIQWFGNQGLLKPLLGGTPVYGALGIVISSIYATFPHALMIILTALLLADGRLYEAAESLGTRTLRRFFTITLPGAKYGLVSAAMVVFSYTVSDFGIPKVIGGNFNVLAVDIYKQVIGQQNFNKGAVVSLILLLPVLVAFVVDWRMQGRQHAQFSARAVPYVARRKPWFANIGKRLIKSPKLYFCDTGLACFLMGIRAAEQLASHPLRGALFETLMVGEALKQRLNHGLPPDLYYYRDSGGHSSKYPPVRCDLQIEVKSGETLPADFFKPLVKLAALVPERMGRRALVHGGTLGQTRGQGEVLPWFGLSAWMDAGMA